MAEVHEQNDKGSDDDEIMDQDDDEDWGDILGDALDDAVDDTVETPIESGPVVYEDDAAEDDEERQGFSSDDGEEEGESDEGEEGEDLVKVQQAMLKDEIEELNARIEEKVGQATSHVNPIMKVCTKLNTETV